MESIYLKERLAKLATLRTESERIGSTDNRLAHQERLKGTICDSAYPAMVGELEALCWSAQFDIEACQGSADRLEITEREHERLISIFEALDIDLDEETISTLELMGRDQEWKDARRGISFAISSAVRNVQEGERDIEHDQATDALIAGGFVYEEDSDIFRRGAEVVTVTLVNGRECRYEWQYQPNGGSGLSIESGKSGEFHRLLALIAPVSQETAKEATQ